jgi:tetratricopeptide (TPR) repeat protein
MDETKTEKEIRSTLERLDLERYWRPWDVIKESSSIQIPRRFRPCLLGVCGSAYRVLNRLEEAEQCIKGALLLADEPLDVGTLLQRLATIEFDRRNINAYRNKVLEAQCVYLFEGMIEGIGKTFVDLAMADDLEDNTDSAIRCADAAFKYPLNSINKVAAHQVIARSFMKAGKVPQALERAQIASQEAREHLPDFVFGKTVWLQAEIAAHSGDLQAAEKLLSRAVKKFTISPADEIVCSSELARCRMLLGHQGLAEAAASHSMKVLKSSSLPVPAVLRKVLRDLMFTVRAAREIDETLIGRLRKQVMLWRASPVPDS